MDFILKEINPMAAPPDLLKTVSAATGLPLATVTDLDRKLVKGKLRPVGGRGLNAVKMGPMEAARLLTAILASPQSNEAADAVSRYMRTSPDKARSSAGLFATAKIEDLAILPGKHSFVDALAALITSLSNGSSAQFAAKLKACPHIEIFAFTRATYGRIRISGLTGGHSVNVEYAEATASKSKKERGAFGVAGDLEQSRRITERTLIPIAKLLAGET